MVEPVDALIEPFAQAGAKLISFHPEATRHIDRTLTLIHEQGCQAGLAFNPATPLHYMDYVMDKLDMVLIMSVNPGFGGQRFLPSALMKIRQARARIDHWMQHGGHAITLEVDGGVKVENIADIHAAGADTFVTGSAIFNQPDYAAVIAALRAQITQGAPPA
jgi:ribulose-phosphate 3-epimerase